MGSGGVYLVSSGALACRAVPLFGTGAEGAAGLPWALLELDLWTSRFMTKAKRIQTHKTNARHIPFVIVGHLRQGLAMRRSSQRFSFSAATPFFCRLARLASYTGFSVIFGRVVIAIHALKHQQKQMYRNETGSRIQTCFRVG